MKERKTIVLFACVALSFARLLSVVGAENSPTLETAERPKIAVFGGSFSCIKPSEVAKRAWIEALDCDVVNFGMGGMGFLRGGAQDE